MINSIVRHHRHPAWLITLLPSRSKQGGSNLCLSYRQSRYVIWIKELRPEWIVGRRQAMHGLLHVFDYKLALEEKWRSPKPVLCFIHSLAVEAIEQCWKGWVTYSYRARCVR